MIRKSIKANIAMLLLGLGGLQAQQAVLATGGEAKGSGGTVSYSVGQVAYTTASSTSGSVAQGVQHTYTISVPTGLDDVQGIDLSVYPNPTTDHLMLSIESNQHTDLSYLLYNANGVLTQSTHITSKRTTIAVDHLASGVFFLKVLDKDSELKTFKIIKN